MKIPKHVVSHLPVTLLMVGFVVRVYHYYANRSLWGDEAELALNLIDRNMFLTATCPLDHNQLAPILFIVFTDIMCSVFGFSEYVLRFLPFLASLCSLFLFLHFAKQLIPRTLLWLSCSFFSFSYIFVFYSHEFKPYSIDLATNLLVLAVYYRHVDKGIKNFHWKILFLGVSVHFLSFASIFSLASVGIVELSRNIMKKEFNDVIRMVAVGLVWVLSIAINYFLFINSSEDFMQAYWQFGFVDHATFSTTVKSLYELVKGLFEYSGFGDSWFVLSLVLFIFGLFFLWKNFEKRIFSLFVLIFSLPLLASFIGKYPFSGRLILFLIPMLMITIVLGIAHLQNTCNKITIFIVVFFISIPSVSSLVRVTTKPIQYIESRKVLQHLEENYSKDDVIVVLNSYAVFDYYTWDSNLMSEAEIVDFSGIVEDMDECVASIRSKAREGKNRFWFYYTGSRNEFANRLLEDIKFSLIIEIEGVRSYLFCLDLK